MSSTGPSELGRGSTREGHLYGLGVRYSPEGRVMRVELDKKALFALASDTRLEILRSLQTMRRTVKQLADAVGIDKAAVHRHLKKLVEGGLVKRYVDHGFVYYGLNRKGRDLLNPDESTKIVILLSSSLVVFFLVALVLATALFAPPFLVTAPGTTEGRDEALTGFDQGDRGIEVPSNQVTNVYTTLAAGLLTVAAVTLLVAAVRIMRKPKQREDGRPYPGRG